MILGGCRRGGAAPRGGMVGEIEGYLWMPRRSANVSGSVAASAAETTATTTTIKTKATARLGIGSGQRGSGDGDRVAQRRR